MLYTRNKDCFKKTTAKVQHNEARKNILNLIKEAVEKDTLPKVSNFDSKQMSENRQKNNELEQQNLSSLFSKDKKGSHQPIICESIYSSTDRRKNERLKILLIEHAFNYSFNLQENQSKVMQAQRQYVSMLQRKIQELEIQISQQRQRVIKVSHEQFERKIKQQYEKEYQKLVRFYHLSRNALVLQSIELLECKNILTRQPQHESRIKCINEVVAKSEELLQIYKRNCQSGSPRKIKQDASKELGLEEMRQVCEFQEKTINFLRSQNPNNPQFNQIKLLRYEINRVCTQNEKLLSRLNEMSKKNSPIKQNKLSQKQMDSTVLAYKRDIQEKNNRIINLEEQIVKLNSMCKELEDKTFRLTYEKECLGEILNIAKTKQQEFQNTIDFYEKQVNELKKASILKLNGDSVVTTEDLFRQLEPYPQYFKLLREIITEYEFKISSLQDLICDERQKKEKYAHWSTEVYNLLQTANIPEEILEKHKEHLYNVDRRGEFSKIQKYLRQIWALSIGMDNREMEIQLQQYIISLKGRNQVIKQVDMQDGSSVAISEHFTDQDFE